MAQCIEDCLECRRHCLETAAQIKAYPNINPSTLVARLCDCADVCETNVGLMLRGSALIGRTCMTCAEICELCAAECDRYVDDVRVQTCAGICRRCAASCRETAHVYGNSLAPYEAAG